MAYVYRGRRKCHAAPRWTEAEDQEGILLLQSGMTCREVGQVLGRSKSSIVQRNRDVWKVPIRKNKPWTEFEEARAKQLLQEGMSYPEVARLLGRTASAVIHKNFSDWQINNIKPREQYRKVTRKNRYHRRYYDDTRYDGKRTICLIRDDFRCQDCGVQDYGDTILNVHHIDGQGKGISMPNNDISNLITLCVRCHMKRHKRKEEIANA